MVYIVLGTGFEPMEAIVPCDILRRGGVDVKFAGIGGRAVTGGHGITVTADCTVEEIDEDALEMIVLPGGLGGVESILGCKAALEIVNRAWDGGKYVAAICAGPTVLAKLGLTAGKTVTCYPGCETQMGSAVMVPDAAAVVDGNVITGTSAGCAVPFALQLITALRGEKAAEEIARQVVIR